MIFHVFKHELRLIFREPRFWIPFVVLPLFLALSQWVAMHSFKNQLFEGMDGYVMLLLGCIMAPMSATLAADSFAGERERNSLELLQLSPIKPFQLFWGKLLAITPFSICFSLLVQLIYWFTNENISFFSGIASILGAVSASFLVNAFTLVISLNVKSVRSATQLSLALIIPLFILVQLFYEIFLSNIIVALVSFLISIAICVLFIVFALHRFCKV